jgi:hypothetical protein
MRKYTFVEFIAAHESDDFDNIDQSSLDWAKNFISYYPMLLESEYHSGDCTNQIHSCPLCLLETYLADYRKYNFDEAEWRYNNL